MSHEKLEFDVLTRPLGLSCPRCCQRSGNRLCPWHLFPFHLHTKPFETHSSSVVGRKSKQKQRDAQGPVDRPVPMSHLPANLSPELSFGSRISPPEKAGGGGLSPMISFIFEKGS